MLVNGEKLAAAPDDTVASALLAGGITTFSTSSAGEPRAPFCNMGACFDCVVTIDGVARRSCLTPVVEGQDVRIDHEDR